MRGTLHLLPVTDAGAYLSLIAEARTWERGSWQKAFGATPAEVAALTDAVAAVLDDRVLTREELVAEVVNAARQHPSRGIAAVRLGDTAEAGRLAGLSVSWSARWCPCSTVDIQGRQAYLLAQDVDELVNQHPSSLVRLLPGFDQYVLGPGTGDDRVVPAGDRADVSRTAGWISPVVIAGGRVVGVWNVANGADSIAVSLWEDVDRVQLDAEIARLSTLIA